MAGYPLMWHSGYSRRLFFGLASPKHDGPGPASVAQSRARWLAAAVSPVPSPQRFGIVPEPQTWHASELYVVMPT